MAFRLTEARGRGIMFLKNDDGRHGMNGKMTKTISAVRWVLAVTVAVVLLIRMVSCLYCPSEAEFLGESLVVDGIRYRETFFVYEETSERIASVNGWDIMTVKGDSSRVFLVAGSFLDSRLFVRDDYSVPADGTITSVYFQNTRHTDPAICTLIASLTKELPGESFTVRADYLRVKDVRVSFDGCPVGTCFVGAVGIVNGYFVYVADSAPVYGTDGQRAERDFLCYVLTDEQAAPLIRLRSFFVNEQAETIGIP